MCIYSCVYMYVWCMYGYIYIYTYIHLCIHTYTYIYIYMYIHMYLSLSLSLSLCTYIHIYIYIDIKRERERHICIDGTTWHAVLYFWVFSPTKPWFICWSIVCVIWSIPLRRGSVFRLLRSHRPSGPKTHAGHRCFHISVSVSIVSTAFRSRSEPPIWRLKTSLGMVDSATASALTSPEQGSARLCTYICCLYWWELCWREHLWIFEVWPRWV